MTRDAGEPGRIRTWLRRDGGQLSVEFTGMVPIILVTLVLLWQAVLVGYTFTLASGAADEGVRKAVAAGAWDMQSKCEAAVLRTLPSAWDETVEIGECGPRGTTWSRSTSA